ncbi:MAG TPA: hypothetical protein VKO18_19425 [Terriglobia bacterium]|nr:hypothetical protein [Terriglobia bacterium]
MGRRESGRMAMETLRDLAQRQDRAVVIVTHDNRVLEWRLFLRYLAAIIKEEFMVR